jgi:hypothetical protein
LKNPEDIVGVNLNTYQAPDDDATGETPSFPSSKAKKDS